MKNVFLAVQAALVAATAEFEKLSFVEVHNSPDKQAILNTFEQVGFALKSVKLLTDEPPATFDVRVGEHGKWVKVPLLSQECLDYMAQGRKINAIKAYRTYTNLGLAESKAACEQGWEREQAFGTVNTLGH